MRKKSDPLTPLSLNPQANVVYFSYLFILIWSILPMYVAIEGVIGVGKTTLARFVHSAFQAELLMEVFEENPFLSDFYSDRSRYAFQTQIFFLLSRYQQQHKVIPETLAAGKMLISDYTFDKDALFAGINLQGDELAMYHRVHEALGEKIPQPDLVVYLRASTETLMQRIAHRDRPYERGMERTYIDELNLAYDAFFAQPKWQDRLLSIDTDDLNIIARPEDLNFVINRIRQTLRMAPYQESLPLNP
ncbi:MAG: deoxynucleoside kinase [Anaerolineaceae bacterium]